ncbi:GGDEF domain-containing protein [Massilia pinisoli]|uniref:diguanylate cyclase n=1 Tax=Massilia pinisoli TaxID=1772194 RepID=A0ABT1ZLC6_9BURK|nr:GGDEF domain-containing protein [Massilia pinisoli]MCS0580693.1 GGDEF domain-containing protein [Massilia pinisoli]
MRTSLRIFVFRLLQAGLVAVVACAPAAADVRAQVAQAEKLADTDPAAALRQLDALAAKARGRSERDLLDAEAARCWLLAYTEPARAIDLAAALLADPANHDAPYVHVCRGYAYERSQRVDDALAEYDHGIEQGRRTGDDAAVARALALRGEQRHVRGLYGDAIADLQEAYAIEHRLGNRGNESYVLNALANLYGDANVRDFDAALDTYARLLAEHEQAGSEREQATAHFNIGSTLENIGDLAGARSHFATALRLDEARGAAAEEIAEDKRAYGVILSKSGDHVHALALLGKAATLLQVHAPGDADAVATLRLSRGAAYRRAGRPLDALVDLEAARRYFAAGANMRFLVKVHEERALAFAQAGDWRAAYGAQRAMGEAQRDIEKQTQDERTARLRVQFQSEQARLRNAELQYQNTLQRRDLDAARHIRRWQYVALGACAGLVVMLSIVAVRQRRFSRRMRDLALTDELTRLPNRRHFMALADEACARSGPLALAALDIDHFKRINDRHGHAAGDVVLQRVAHALRVALRPGDAIGRTGGEEFLALLVGATEDDAVGAAERLRAAVGDIDCAGLPAGVRPSISIGVAAWLGPDDTLDALCRRADAALYAAKEGGRNRVELAAA